MGADALRLAVIGCGRVFERYHLPAIRACPAVRLAAVCEPDAARRAWLSDRLADVPCAADVTEWLAAGRLDAAVVSTPPAAHALLVERLLAAGLHVLVEKPMALSRAEAQRLCAVQRASGRVLRVGFNRRYRSDYRTLRRRAVNAVQRVAFTFIADAARWQGGSGGSSPAFVLHDAGSHAVDLVAYVTGRGIERVAARLEEAQAGAVIVRIDAELADGVAAACRVGHAPRYEESCAVTAAGRIRRVAVSAGLSQRARLAACRLTGRPTPTDESFRAQLAGFADACRGRDDGLGAGPAEGLASVAAIEACLASLADGGAPRNVSVDHLDSVSALS